MNKHEYFAAGLAQAIAQPEPVIRFNSLLKEMSADAEPTPTQVHALLIVSRQSGVTGADRACNLSPEIAQDNAGDPDAIMVRDADGWRFAGMAGTIIRKELEGLK